MHADIYKSRIFCKGLRRPHSQHKRKKRVAVIQGLIDFFEGASL